MGVGSYLNIGRSIICVKTVSHHAQACLRQLQFKWKVAFKIWTDVFAKTQEFDEEKLHEKETTVNLHLDNSQTIAALSPVISLPVRSVCLVTKLLVQNGGRWSF